MDLPFEKALQEAQQLVLTGKYGEGAERFRSLFEHHSESPEILVALAEAMAHVGQTDASLALLADSVDASNPDPAILVRISDQLREVGRIDEAADFLLCALACSPGDASLSAKTESVLKALGRTAQLEWLKDGADGEMPSARLGV